MSLRSYHTRIVRYTLIYRTYYIISEGGKIRIVKDPQTIVEENTSSNNKTRDTSTPSSSEDEADDENKAQQKEQPWQHMKTPDELTKLYESKKLTCPKKPTIKITHTIDSPFNQQMRERPDQDQWDKAWEKEQKQLQRYTVYTVVPENKILEQIQIVNTKLVYKI